MAAVKDWTFEGTWPYEPKWFDSPDGRMHYVDEGPRDGRPVVMVHGNPTWGYLYRNFIGPLVEAGHRAIVPDHLGFGRSEKPRDAELYRVPRHARRLDALLESLDLRGAVVVPQDWGGPTGLYWATQHPERVDGLFILNTFAHGFRPETLPPGKDKIPLPLPLRLFRTPVVGEVCSTLPARPTVTWPSASVPMCALAPAWLAWRFGWPSPSCWRGLKPSRPRGRSSGCRATVCSAFGTCR